MKWILLFLLLVTSNLIAQNIMENYVFFNVERYRISEKSFIENDVFAGAQLKYTWPELEPEKGKYNFDLIQKDLDFLELNGKGLFIQIQDVSFDTTIINVPRYIIEDPIYNGGIEIQFDLNDEETEYVVVESLVARRWDKKVADRFHHLLKALGNKFDGKITGINLPETAVGFGNVDMHPLGYSHESYRNAIKENMRVLKEAFPNSIAIQYANFMPGDKFPLGDDSYLESIYSYANEIEVGMGGPDVKVYKYWQMEHSMKFLKKYSDNVKAVAVQWGNYEEINPKTKRQVTIDEIYNFAVDEIGLNYIFWCTQEPYYTEYLIPYLKKVR